MDPETTDEESKVQEVNEAESRTTSLADSGEKKKRKRRRKRRRRRSSGMGDSAGAAQVGDTSDQEDSDEDDEEEKDQANDQIDVQVSNGGIDQDQEHTDKKLKHDEPINSLIWTEPKQLPKYLQKYWRQRYTLFSKFDDGVALDLEGWYSVTPEKVAEHIAQRCKGLTVLDAFCGVGGNTIQFAKVCKNVVTVDIDPVKLECTMHNAGIYGVSSKIEYRTGDFMSLAPSLDKVDVVFLSPPWGGPEYLQAERFDLNTMLPINGKHLFEAAEKLGRNVIFYVPRNSDVNQLLSYAGPGEVCELEEVYLNHRLKVLVAYYGDIARRESMEFESSLDI